MLGEETLQKVNFDAVSYTDNNWAGANRDGISSWRGRDEDCNWVLATDQSEQFFFVLALVKLDLSSP